MHDLLIQLADDYAIPAPSASASGPAYPRQGVRAPMFYVFQRMLLRYRRCHRGFRVRTVFSWLAMLATQERVRLLAKDAIISELHSIWLRGSVLKWCEPLPPTHQEVRSELTENDVRIWYRSRPTNETCQCAGKISSQKDLKPAVR